MPDGHTCYYTGQSEPCPNDAEVERLRVLGAAVVQTIDDLENLGFVSAGTQTALRKAAVNAWIDLP